MADTLSEIIVWLMKLVFLFPLIYAVAAYGLCDSMCFIIRVSVALIRHLLWLLDEGPARRYAST
jgi:hypothetical protein